jgi:hypothetical protein
MRLVNYMIVVLAIIAATGCETAQEAARSNITTTWKIDKVTRNGTDDTAAYISNRNDYKITFDDEGGFVESYVFLGTDPTSITGTWSINSNTTALSLQTDFSSRSYLLDLIDENNLQLTDQGQTDEVKIFYVLN